MALIDIPKGPVRSVPNLKELERKQQELAEQHRQTIKESEAVLSLASHPAWDTVSRVIAEKQERAIRSLIREQDVEKMRALQAEVQAWQTVANLPQYARQAIQAAQEALARLNS